MPTSLQRAVIFTLFAAMAPDSPAQTDDLHRFITDDFKAGLVARPARLLNSKFVRELVAVTNQQKALDEQLQTLKEQIGLDPREAEEVLMLLDRSTIFSLAGLPALDAVENTSEKPTTGHMGLTKRRNHLKQLGLAMHNFHGVYNTFPAADGIEATSKGNLSWRVHLLPYLGQHVLFERFHLDEAWDSGHNKTLIDDMPAVFTTNGVKNPWTYLSPCTDWGSRDVSR